jgi:hypothetical protein
VRSLDRHRIVAAVAAALVVAVAAPAGARALERHLAKDTLWANALAALGGTMRPGDFGYVFLVAGDDVLAGRSPYMDADEFEGPPQAPYAYPPVLAIAVTPLSALPETVRGVFLPGVAFSLVLAAAMVGGIRMLGVRDWRCYPIALLSPFTLEAIEYGAVGPLLVLLVAVAWRYRDPPWLGGAATGVLVVLKLFLWPLVVWLAVTGRARGAAIAVLAAGGLALASWALIAFRGFFEYPRLLRKLVDVEAEQSYSAFALLRALEIPGLAARGLVLVAGVALLGMAWRAARDERRDVFDRDRVSLGLSLAAALVLTPILWLHYLVLLFVPIALARPRLSWVWGVPIALTVLEWRDWYRGWPRGELDALLSVFLAALLVLVVTLRQRAARISDESVGAART